MELNKVIAENAYEEANLIYFPLVRGNSLYVYNKDSGESRRISDIMPTSCPSPHYRLCEVLTVVDKKIIVAPSFGMSCIGMFDLLEEKMAWIDVSKFVKCGNRVGTPFKFVGCFSFGNFVFLFGGAFPAILKLNVTTKEITTLKTYDRDCNMFLLQGIAINHMIYMPYANESKILLLNMEDESIQDLLIEGDYAGFAGIVLDEFTDELYLNIKDTNMFVEIDFSGRVIETYTIEKAPEINVPLFENMIGIETGFYVFPVCANSIYYFDYSTKKFHVVEDFQPILDASRKDDAHGERRVFSFSTRPNFVYLIDINSKKWYEMNLLDRKITSFCVYQALNSIYDSLYKGYLESKTFGLDDYIEWLENQEQKAPDCR